MERTLRTQMQGTYTPPNPSSIKLKPGPKKLPKGTHGFVLSHVDDPYAQKTSQLDKPSLQTPKIRVVQRSSDNPLLELLNRKRIDEAQFLAGHKYMGAYMICLGHTGQGIDYSRQRVDCASAPMTLTEKQINAQDVIRNANRALLKYGHNIRCENEAVTRIKKIAGEGLSVTNYCCSVLGLKSSKSVSKQMIYLREDLSVLAKHWCFEGR
ncbi:MAG: hypothetical protein ABJO86_05795 [Lentilitoribacter sp.]